MKSAIILCLLGPLFTALSQDSLTLSVKVHGVDNRDILKDGIKPNELTNLTIDVNGQSLHVDEFDVIHARGKSPLGSLTSIKGNSCDVSSFRRKAKPGDRLVINIKSIVNNQPAPIEFEKLVVLVPIR